MIRTSTVAAPLLPGEVSRSDVLEDAEHWAAVYQELTRFLLTTRCANSDATGRFRARLEYWRRRRDELAHDRLPARSYAGCRRDRRRAG